MKRTRGWLAVGLAAMVLFAACGSDKKASSGGSGSSTSAVSGSTKLTDSFRGVTASTIKLGFVIVDYDAIKQFVDFSRGDQQAVAQVFVDHINKTGGILGRKVEPVFMKYSPIGNADALKLCTALTEDDKVFAVLGVFIDFSGDAQACLARDHETIHIGHELRQAFIDDAPPGLLLSPDITQERRIDVLMNLVKREGSLKGKTVAILADQETKGNVDDVIKPALDGMKVKQGSTAVLSIAGTDTSAAQAQLDSFIEKWKNEGVDALVMSGLQVSAKQFVEKIRAGLPKLLLLTDGPQAALEAGQDETASGKKPNPYEGMLSADGLSASEQWKLPAVQACVKTYQEATGQTVVGPDDLKPNAEGKRVEIWIAVRDFCDELSFFEQIAEKAGADLTNDSWTEAVDSFGAIKLTGSKFGSLKKGKYDADNGFRLISFDSTIGEKGDWKPITTIEDASKG
jgi:hypothetical protein